MLLNRRGKFALLMGCIVVFLLAPVMAWLLPGTTEVTIGNTATDLYAEVSGTRLRLPPNKLDPLLRPRLRLPHSSDQLTSDPPDVSRYWQPAQPGLFYPLGLLGEWIQTLRPAPGWTYVGAGVDNTAHYSLKAGRGASTIALDAQGASGGYAFVVRPERRNMGWWRTENSRPVEELASAAYRPSGFTSLQDMASELMLTLWWASGFCLLAFGVGALAGRLRGDRSLSVRIGANRYITLLNRPYAPALALFFCGTLASTAVCLGVLDGIPHVQDDVAYLFQGRIFALFRSWVPTPPGPEFFQNAYIQMYEGRWFSKYPPGYPLLLTPGLWAGLPWFINPLSAGVSLALVYATGLRMYGRHVAAWAGLLGLVSPWVLFMSGSYMSHPTTMMWVALFLYSLVRLHEMHRAGRSRVGAWALLTGFSIGMAFITREWTTLGIGVGAAIWALADLIARREGKLKLLRRYMLVLVGFVPPLLFLLYENRQLTGEWLRLAQDLVGSYDRPGFGPGHGDAQGHTPALGVYNTLLHLRSLATMFDGWPAPLALAPIALGLIAWLGDKSRRYIKWDALLWLCLLSLVGAYFVWWYANTIFGPRYWYEGMPFLLLLAGRGLDLLGKVAILTWKRAGEAARWAFPSALFGLMTLYNITQSLPYGVSQYTNYNNISPTALYNAEAAYLENALVFVELHPARRNRDYGKVFFANDPLLRGNIIYVRDLGRPHNESLLSAFPGRVAYWLPLNGPPKPGFGP